MAKVSIEYDTSSKKLAVSMDGKALDNVASVSFYETYDSLYDKGDESADTFSFSMTLLDESTTDDGYKTCTHIVARDTPDGRKAVLAGAGTYLPCIDLVASKQGRKVREDIENYFRKNR